MRKRNGFSFVELLVAFTLFTLLAGIAVVQLGSVRQRVFTGVLKSDLRNFAIAQESFHYDNDVYAADTTALQARGYQLSTGTQITVNEATVAGWAATASHSATSVLCYMFVPGAAPVGLATTPGVIACG